MTAKTYVENRGSGPVGRRVAKRREHHVRIWMMMLEFNRTVCISSGSDSCETEVQSRTTIVNAENTRSCVCFVTT